MTRITACFRTHCFASQKLSACEGITDPRDNTVPLALLGCGVVNQHAVHEATSKITAVVQILPLRKLETAKKFGGTRYRQCSRAGSSLQETQPVNLRHRLEQTGQS